MSVYRVDVLVEDSDVVFDWQRANIPTHAIVRSKAYRTTDGWYIKTVFTCPDYAERFHRKWHPELNDHTVPPF